MEEAPRTTEFATAAGISVSYASQILNGQREPSRALAISIYRKTGRKLGPITEATDAEIDLLERFHPQPSAEAA